MVILASQSPRRQELLKRIVSDFRVEPSGSFRHFAQEKRIIDRYRLTHTALRRFGGNGDHPAELACDLKAVSYTHLDVYKRQMKSFTKGFLFGKPCRSLRQN